MVAAFAALLYLISVPFIDLFHHVFVVPPEVRETLAFHPLREVLNSSMLMKAVVNSLLLSSGVALLSTFIGVALSYILARTDIPMANFWRSAFVLPYAIPPIVGAIAWILLANPSNGHLNNLFGWHLNIYSFTGLLFVESTFLYTTVLLVILKSLETMDPSLEEAARMSGATPFKSFLTITLPLLKTPIFNGFVLSFLGTLASFGVPALIGTPGGIFLMTTQIYTFQKMGSMAGLLKAGALSFYLLVGTLILLFISEGPLSRKQYSIVTGKTPRQNRISLGFWRLPIFLVLVFLIMIIFALPMASIIFSAFSKVQGNLTFSQLTDISNYSLENFNRIFFETAETGRAFKNSFLAAGGASLFALVVGLLLAFILRYLRMSSPVTMIKNQTSKKWSLRQMLERLPSPLISVPYATPGTVLALALMVGFGPGIFKNWLPLNNTLLIIILAYFLKYLSFSYKTMNDGVGQIDRCLDEASRLSGAGPWRTFINIWVPLLRPSMFAAFFLVFMPALFEVTMSVLLAGPGQETVGTLLFQLQEYGDHAGGGPAVLAVAIVLPCAFVNFFLKWISKGKYGL